METRANYVVVGAFVLSCFIAVIVAALWLAGAEYNKQFAHYEAYFSGSVTGLGNGTPVRYNGIDVGRVTRLKFDPDNPKQVIVFMEVDPTLTLHSDSVASIASMGLTGGSYLEIDGGTKDAPMLEAIPGQEYPVIPSKPSTLQEIANSAPAVIDKLNRIGDQLSDLLNRKNRQALSNILQNTDKLTAALAAKSEAMSQTIDNLRESSGALTGDLAALHTTLDRGNEALAQITKLSKDADALVGGDTAQQLSQLVADTRATVNSLRNLSTSLQNEPTSLIFGARRKGYKPQ